MAITTIPIPSMFTSRGVIACSACGVTSNLATCWLTSIGIGGKEYNQEWPTKEAAEKAIEILETLELCTLKKLSERG